MPAKPPPRHDRLLAPLSGLPAEVLLAVSGGMDSCALLDAMVLAGRPPKGVLHFSHGWRETDSEEADFVRGLAERRGIPFTEAVGFGRSGRVTEAAARVARYVFFEQAAARLGCPDVVLAHHADDQVETFLLQLLRGAGVGLRGMRPVAGSGAFRVHRPWLGVWREEIEVFARDRKIEWREDPTNADCAHRRNRVRHELLPYLHEHFSPAAKMAIWKASEILQAEDEWIETLTKPHVREELEVVALRAMPVAQARRVIRAWLRARDIRNIDFSQVEAVRQLLHQTRPARVNLAANWQARRSAGRLKLHQLKGKLLPPSS